ncbi:MAG: hypothetical protein R3F11_17135 [Verrucomicrobiales bacterium]
MPGLLGSSISDRQRAEAAAFLERHPPGHYDPFRVADDWARLEYGRMLWRSPRLRARLIRHWTDERHPYRERFAEKYRPLVERVLADSGGDDEALDRQLRADGYSLREIVREIPPVFGSFY